MTSMPLRTTAALMRRVLPLLLLVPALAWAQGGPPFLTNDPGTPGDGNWEINLGSMQSIARGGSAYQLPQLDLNLGLGDRIQLTYEVPYALQADAGQPQHSGWGNAFAGVKWRFLDQGEQGWQLSTFPQLETGVSAHAQLTAIGTAGPRYLVPLEASRTLGPLQLNVEAGYYIPGHGPKERILGIVAGRALTRRLELDAEIYDDRIDHWSYGGASHVTTFDVGGRYQLHAGIIALFLAGRSLNGIADGQPELFGYLGVQILLTHYGRTLNNLQH
jgi:hypothetical protein